MGVDEGKIKIFKGMRGKDIFCSTDYKSWISPFITDYRTMGIEGEVFIQVNPQKFIGPFIFIWIVIVNTSQFKNFARVIRLPNFIAIEKYTIFIQVKLDFLAPWSVQDMLGFVYIN